MNVCNQTRRLRYRGRTARVGRAASAVSYPHFMGMLVSGGLLCLLVPIAFGAAELPLPVADVYMKIAATVAGLALLMSGLHFSTVVDPASGVVLRRRRFLWIPLWSRTWSFDKVRSYTMRSPHSNLRTSYDPLDPEQRNPHGNDLLGLPLMVVVSAVTATVTVLWDLFTPFKLYFVTRKGRQYLVAAGMNQAPLALLGRKLATRTGAWFQ